MHQSCFHAVPPPFSLVALFTDPSEFLRTSSIYKKCEERVYFLSIPPLSDTSTFPLQLLTMGIPKQEHYLLTKRDEAEKNRFVIFPLLAFRILIYYRLNQQNTTANAVRGGHTLDPAIPKHEITRIADIATGTG